MPDDGTERFKASEWRPSKFAGGFIALLLIVPLFSWYLELLFLAVFAGLSYWDLKRIRRRKAQDALLRSNSDTRSST
jgi:membrane protein implicated in regulation of membrane protease activity